MTEEQPCDFNPSERDYRDKVSLLSRVYAALAPGPYALGVDLSHWNASVDFKALKAGGFEFVILKATEQTGWTDPTFSSRWPAALDAGLIVGTYHFFRGNYDGMQQADYHRSVIQPLLDATGGKVIPLRK